MKTKRIPNSISPASHHQKVRKLKVRLKGRSYSICIGSKIISSIDKYLEHNRIAGQPRAFVISDRSLVKTRKSLLQALRKAGWNVQEISVKAGEGFKELESIVPIFGELLRHKADRDSVIFALGGGSIGDAVGFIAATYLRGVAWVGIPTTLLAQVDSSVGGKTGINHPQGKNLIGSFHQPISVLCDLDVLRTLSRREIVSGLGEILKYGLIYDSDFFAYVRGNWNQAIAQDSKTLSYMVTKSLTFKTKVVETDEFDRTGVREALNFGHTFGHALEKATGYGYFQHGEAVLWGMRFATTLSYVYGSLNQKSYTELTDFLASIDLPKLPPKISFAEYLRHMGHDKKLRAGRVHFVLLKRIGKCFSCGDLTKSDLLKSFRLMEETYGT